jgi:ankyrin repeat protein
MPKRTLDEKNYLFYLFHHSKIKEAYNYLLTLELQDLKNIRNEWNSTLLHYAVWIGCNKSIKYLVSKGVDINAINDNGESCLMWCARKLDVDNFKYLLENGGDSTIKTIYDETIIDISGSWIMFPDENKIETLELLLQNYVK